ncbi:MAG: Hsp20 family protein [Candidatus Eisenbacteria bacterium]|nr:Hsp20 family protein [Candidatus Eisenbacteria bacterium]
MNTINEALENLNQLYRELTGQDLPQTGDAPYAPLPQNLDPWICIDQGFRHLGGLLQASLAASSAPRTPSWMPPVDVKESEAAWEIAVWAAGSDKDSFRISWRDAWLLVEGRRCEEDAPESPKTWARETPQGPFARALPFPAGCDPESSHARYQDGILHIHLAKSASGPSGPAAIRVD